MVVHSGVSYVRLACGLGLAIGLALELEPAPELELDELVPAHEQLELAQFELDVVAAAGTSALVWGDLHALVPAVDYAAVTYAALRLVVLCLPAVQLAQGEASAECDSLLGA